MSNTITKPTTVIEVLRSLEPDTLVYLGTDKGSGFMWIETTQRLLDNLDIIEGMLMDSIQQSLNGEITLIDYAESAIPESENEIRVYEITHKEDFEVLPHLKAVFVEANKIANGVDGDWYPVDVRKSDIRDIEAKIDNLKKEITILTNVVNTKNTIPLKGLKRAIPVDFTKPIEEIIPKVEEELKEDKLKVKELERTLKLKKDAHKKYDAFMAKQRLKNELWSMKKTLSNLKTRYENSLKKREFLEIYLESWDKFPDRNVIEVYPHRVDEPGTTIVMEGIEPGYLWFKAEKQTKWDLK